jgi:DNA-binding transcriptional LysR family regulator
MTSKLGVARRSRQALGLQTWLWYSQRSMRPLPFDLADLQAFVATVNGGSLARASAQLGSSKSVLSRRIAALEYALGTQLLVRDRRGARMTESGTDLHRTATEVLARLEQVRDEAATALAELAGRIRVTAPLSFGTTYLAPALAAFAAQHPAVELEVSLDDHVIDLLAGGFDVALRIGAAPDLAVGARLLADVQPRLVASPAYIARRGRPMTAASLVGHDILEYTNEGLHFWRSSFGAFVDVGSMAVRYRADNGELLRSAAASGLGLLILPDFLVKDAVDQGELEVLLPSHAFPSAGLYAVPAPGRPKLRRVRALIDHLTHTFGPRPPWSMSD